MCEEDGMIELFDRFYIPKTTVEEWARAATIASQLGFTAKELSALLSIKW